MKKIFLLLFLLGVFNAYSQQEASNWYFGDNAGIQFDTTAGTVTALNDGQLATEEGCTSISDTNGNLLFYTDGITVFNANHGIMVNGTGLLGDPSSSQSGLIVPKPGDPNIYYIFTVGSNASNTGLKYSTVDITLAGGLGEVTSKNINLLTSCSEKISAVLKDCVTGNIWVTSLSTVGGNGNSGMNSFHAFEVSATGVNTTAVVSTLSIGINDSRGNLKFSPDATKLACANVGSGLFIADFDKATGIVSNRQFLTIGTTANDRPYGVEFSPNSQLLYVTSSNDFFVNATQNADPTNHSASLIQYDLNAANISNSQITIDERQLYRGGLQLGPDGKIYRALSSTYGQGIANLGVIADPNTIGIGCTYQHLEVSLGANVSRQGLPPFIQSFFTQQIDIIQNGVSTIELSLCVGDTYTLMADDIPNSTYIWTKDGVVLPETDFDLIVSETGFYEVDIVSTAGDCGSLEGSAQVDFFDVPVANVPSNLPACDDDNDGFWLFDLSQQNPDILLAQDPMQFEVEYYASLADATNGQSQISGNYQNTSNPQIIYARVENVDYRRCVDIVPFEIQVYNTPEIINTMPLNACDEDSNAMDGQTSINLLDFNTEILGTQNPALYTITYHSTSNDAMTNTSALPDNYTNATPFTETIYVRIENNNNTDCFATGDFIVNINPIPEAFNSNLYQCDEIGIVDGLTLFNLTEANEALTGNTPDRSTQFYPSLIDAQNDTSELNATSYTNISNPQTVYVKVTNDITGCVNYSELVLEASNTQISDYVAPAVCDELNSEDGINTFNLDDFSTVILTGLPAGLDIAYYETSSDALLEQNPLNSIYNNSTPYSQTIYVRVENANACYGINEVLLTINPLPELESDETILYCLNDFPTTITISGNVINGGTNSFNYAWSNGANTPAIDINATGTYTVTVTNNTTGCSKTRTVTVEPSNIATIENIEITDGSLGNNQITVITSGEGEYEYALVNQDGDSTVYQESNVFSQIPPGIYTVMVRDIKNNCGIVNDMLSVIGFPLYFTPNGDTVNDTWQVYGVSEEFQSKSEIIIYDRYGKLITQIKASSKGWDGTYNGVPLPTSDYWFSVILEDGRVYKNHFTLKR